ncbi:MAG: hotdog fold domain-containing protein [Acidobacteriaceae bacterium]
MTQLVGKGRRKLLRLMNLWPPLLGAGIRVVRMDAEMREIDVEMRMRRWNRNYVGAHFGGSLFAMTDPFYMMMVMENLGRGFVVWDKAASIRFRRPGKGTMRAEFRLTEERLQEIRSALARDGRVDTRFAVEVRDGGGVVVAEVERVLYCATKEAYAARSGG